MKKLNQNRVDSLIQAFKQKVSSLMAIQRRIDRIWVNYGEFNQFYENREAYIFQELNYIALDTDLVLFKLKNNE